MSEKKYATFCFLATAIGIFIIFSSAINGAFLNWDDTSYITLNPLLAKPFSFSAFISLYEFDRHISLVLFSIMAQLKIFGLGTTHLHLFNVFCHIINVYFVYRLSSVLFKDKNLSLFVALIFAVHPLKAESVMWIIQRKDVLFSFFFLSGLHFYINYLKTERIIFFLAAFLAAFFSSLCKAQALTLPFTFILVEFYMHQRISIKSVLLNSILLFALIMDVFNIKQIIVFVFFPLLLLSVDKILFTFNKKTIIRFRTFSTSSFYLKGIEYFDLTFILILPYLYYLKWKVIEGIPVHFLGLFVLLLLLYFFYRISGRKYFSKQLLLYAAFFAIIGIGVFIGLLYSGSGVSDFDWLQRILYAGFSLGYYIKNFFVPFGLTAMIPYPEPGELSGFSFIIYPITALVFTIIVVLVSLRIKNKEVRNIVVFGYLFFLINISVVLHIIPIQGRVIVANRYTYLAYWGLSVAIVATFLYFYRARKHSKIESFSVKAFITLVLLVFSIQTYSTGKNFKNSKSFWEDIIQNNQRNHYAHFSLGLWYYESNNANKAIECYNKAIQLYIKDYHYFANRGAAYVKSGKYDDAFTDFTSALKLNPLDYFTYNNRGMLYFDLGNLNAAKSDFEKALALNKGFVTAQTQLNETMALLDSSNVFEENKTPQPLLSDYYLRSGLKKAGNNNIDEALYDFKQALYYQPDNLKALRNRSNAFAYLKNFEEALKDLEMLLKINPNDAPSLLNKGNIKHQTGDVVQACSCWNQALMLGLKDAQMMLDRFCQ